MSNANALTGETRNIVADMGQVIAQTDVLVKQMNSAMRGINIDLQQVPELIGRMQLLLDSTDRTLQGIQRIYPISAAVDESGKERSIKVLPSNE